MANMVQNEADCESGRKDFQKERAAEWSVSTSTSHNEGGRDKKLLGTLESSLYTSGFESMLSSCVSPSPSYGPEGIFVASRSGNRSLNNGIFRTPFEARNEGHQLTNCITCRGKNHFLCTMGSAQKELHRNAHMFDKHEYLSPSVRIVIVKHLTQVIGKSLQLHRETIYKAINYIDKYIDMTSNLCDSNMELVTTTAAFIAAKYEEVYPPKLEEFVDLTVGCSAQQVRAMESILLKALDCRLSVVTSQNWLGLFMRMKAEYDFNDGIEKNCRVITSVKSGEREFPDFAFDAKRFPRQDFAKLVQVLDLCMFDLDSLKFSDAVLAAAVFSRAYENDKRVVELTSFSLDELADALEFIEPFVVACEKFLPAGDPFPSPCDNWDDMCNFQALVQNADLVTLLLEEAELVKTALKTARNSSVLSEPRMDGKRAAADFQKGSEQSARKRRRNINEQPNSLL